MKGRHRKHYRVRRLLPFVLIVALLLLPASSHNAEDGFLSAINSTRVTNGLEVLVVDDGLRAYARFHTQAMVDADEIFHSSGDELREAAGPGWTRLGENVGRGGTVDSLHEAFMDSEGHRSNILGDFNLVGIGTATQGGVLYVTVIFVEKVTVVTTTTTIPAIIITTPTTTTTTPPEPTTTTTLAPCQIGE